MEKISLKKMAQLIKDFWIPLDVFRVNDTVVRLVKIKGKYHWHKHSDQDELFIVLEGKLRINMKGKKLELEEGEGFVVKKGTLHQTEAEEETLVLLVEPEGIQTRGD